MRNIQSMIHELSAWRRNIVSQLVTNTNVCVSLCIELGSPTILGIPRLGLRDMEISLSLPLSFVVRMHDRNRNGPVGQKRLSLRYCNFARKVVRNKVCITVDVSTVFGHHSIDDGA